MSDLKNLYLNMVRKSVTNMIYQDVSMSPWNFGVFNEKTRENGEDWPSVAHTMIGDTRLKNIQYLAEKIIESGIPGDFMETGVWRGGACIFMNAILKAHNIKDRKVWVCDSFEGLPPPDAKYQADAGDIHYQLHEFLAVSLEKVQENFRRYDLLDENVNFVKGFFRDTMPAITNQVDKLSLLRMDGDMYESTIDVLNYMYPKLSVGGYTIIDDWLLPNCRQAVLDYFQEHDMNVELIKIDKSSVYWMKT